MNAPDRPGAWGLWLPAMVVTLAAALVVARETFVLPLLPMLAALLGAGAAVVAVAGHGLEGVGYGLVAVGVATSSWNAVSIGPLKLTHIALATATLPLAIVVLTSGRPIRLPGWVWLLSAVLAAITVLALLLPPDPAAYAARYDDGRTVLSPDGPGAAALGAGVQWLVAVLVLPLLVCVAVLERPRRLRVLADAWVLGATLNAVAAIGDELGLTRISAMLLAEVDRGGRQAALTVQPNHAALAFTIALPLAVWRIADARTPTVRLAAIAATVLLGAGLVTTGSRAGFVAAVVGAALAMVVDARLRRHVPAVAAVVVAGAVVAVAAVPQLLLGAAQSLRLVDGLGADASDAIRARLAAQAVDDVLGSPVRGLGPQVADQAHNIYLQLLAAGGVILFGGFLVAQLGFLLDARRLRDRLGGLGGALAVSGATFLVAGAVSNQLSDVFVMVPWALAAGLWATHAHASVPVEASRPPVPVSSLEEACS